MYADVMMPGKTVNRPSSVPSAGLTDVQRSSAGLSVSAMVYVFSNRVGDVSATSRKPVSVQVSDVRDSVVSPVSGTVWPSLV